MKKSDDKIICRKEVELLGMKFIVYLKEVNVRTPIDGSERTTTIRAFVRRVW